MAPSEDTNPLTDPTRLETWLGELPPGYTADNIARIGQILAEAEDLRIPYKTRFQSLETLYPFLGELFEAFRPGLRHLELPVPEGQWQKILCYRQTLSSLVHNYQAVILETEGRSGLFGPNRQQIAIYRALSTAGMLLLSELQAYQPPRRNFWSEVYSLYRQADNNGLLDKPIKPEYRERPELATIEAAFRQILILPMTRPYGLSQSDMEAVHELAGRYVSLTRLEPDGEVNEVSHLSVDPEIDLPPGTLPIPRLRHSNTVLHLAAEPLLEKIQGWLDAEPEANLIRVGEDFSIRRTALERLLVALGNRRSRAFARVETSETATATIGLARIHALLSESQRPAEPVHREPTAAATGLEELSADQLQLKPKGDEHPRTDLEIGQPTGDQSEEYWDLVARGHVFTRAYDPFTGRPETESASPGDRPARPGPRDRTGKTETTGQWRVLNTSAGGYRFRWELEKNTPAHVGELMAIWESEAADARCQVGEIRWMRYASEVGLDIGVELLAGNAHALDVLSAPHGRATCERALLLPANPAYHRPPTLLVPSYCFAMGTRLKLAQGEHAFSMTLGRVQELTDAFTQFHFHSPRDHEALEIASVLESGQAGGS